MENDKHKLTLNKIDELERLVHKKTTTGSGIIRRQNLKRLEVDSSKQSGEYIYRSKYLAFSYGTFVINLYVELTSTYDLTSSTTVEDRFEDSYEIKLFLNGNEILYKVGVTSFRNLVVDMSVSTYIYETPCILELHIKNTKPVYYQINKLYFDMPSKTELFLDNYCKEKDIGTHSFINRFEGISIGMRDGVDMNGDYAKKYAIGFITTDNVGYVYEKDAKDFNLNNIPVVLQIPDCEYTTFLSVGYNCMKLDDSICYRHLVAHYQSTTSTISKMANVNQQRTNVDSIFEAHNKAIYTAHQSDSKTIYSYMMTVGRGAMYYGDGLTNTFIGDSSMISYTPDGDTTQEGDFLDGCMPLVRNLNEVYKKPYPLIIKKGLLYSVKDGDPTLNLVEGVPAGVSKIAGMTYIDDDSSDVDVYLLIGGYTYRYRLAFNMIAETYSVDTSVTVTKIGYGILQFSPLYDNDALIVTKSHVYFTNKREEIWL